MNIHYRESKEADDRDVLRLLICLFVAILINVVIFIVVTTDPVPAWIKVISVAIFVGQFIGIAMMYAATARE